MWKTEGEAHIGVNTCVCVCVCVCVGGKLKMEQSKHGVLVIA